jgi:hypothetical protein
MTLNIILPDEMKQDQLLPSSHFYRQGERDGLPRSVVDAVDDEGFIIDSVKRSQLHFDNSGRYFEDPESSRAQIKKIMLRVLRGESVSPVLIDTRGNVLDGQHRLCAYQALGIEDIPVARSLMNDVLYDNHSTRTRALGIALEDNFFTQGEIDDALLDKNTIELSALSGGTLSVFHGTNRLFDAFDAKQHRTALNDNYQGDWFCFTQDQKVSWRYAEANRNGYLNRDVFFHETASVFAQHTTDDILREALMTFVEVTYKNGLEERGGYEAMIAVMIQGGKQEIESHQSIIQWEESSGINLMTLEDIVPYVEGAARKGRAQDTSDIIGFLQGKTMDKFPEHFSDELEKWGYDQCVLRPRNYACDIQCEKVLYTENPATAKRAGKENVYDVVFYAGEDCVNNEPEILVKNENQIRIKHIEKQVIDHDAVPSHQHGENWQYGGEITYYKAITEKSFIDKQLNKRVSCKH